MFKITKSGFPQVQESKKQIHNFFIDFSRLKTCFKIQDHIDATMMFICIWQKGLQKKLFLKYTTLLDHLLLLFQLLSSEQSWSSQWIQQHLHESLRCSPSELGNWNFSACCKQEWRCKWSASRMAAIDKGLYVCNKISYYPVKAKTRE